MSNIARVAGQAANTTSKPLDITDMFSTYLYEGTSSAQTITNGIDLDGEGGLVWMKNRTSSSYSHALQHTTIADGGYLSSNTTAAFQAAANNGISAFNSDGFTFDTGNWEEFNNSSHDYASWTFRKAPKFFDVVTYTGNGVGGLRTFSHSLNSDVGMIIVKDTSATAPWVIYHKGLPSGNNMEFTTGISYANGYFSTAPTASVFSIDSTASVGTTNISGNTYVAYLFAHNDSGDGEFGPDGDADVIKCGSVAGGATVDLGWEPQWVLTKSTDAAGSWWLMDSMRGMPVGGAEVRLQAETNADESALSSYNYIDINSTGFTMKYPASNHIYMAIRRGPLAVPDDATKVFAIDTYGGAGGGVAPAWRSGFPVDMAYYKDSASTSNNWNMSRLTGEDYLYFNTTAAAAQFSAIDFDYNNGYWGNGGTAATTYSWMWKRAPGFFDVVAYTGNGTAGRTVSHNLGVAPEMMWVKRRDSDPTYAWATYVEPLGAGRVLFLERSDTGLDTSSFSPSSNYIWGEGSNPTAPTSDVFTLGANERVNASGGNYIAYLFASVAGVSKVGSYTGNGSNQTINCGFSAGSRFILIKRTDSSGDWYVWDTARGIVAGDDPHLSLNTTAAEVTSDDSIDPASSGFIVNQVGATNINVSSATYIFYAIA